MYRPHVSNDPALLKSGALTTSYVASSSLKMKGWNAAVIMLDADLDVAGGATGLQVYVEIANPAGDTDPTATEWYALTANDEQATTATGDVSFASGKKIWDFGAADGRYAITIDRLAAKYLRVQIKTAGVAGTTTCAVRVAQALV